MQKQKRQTQQRKPTMKSWKVLVLFRVVVKISVLQLGQVIQIGSGPNIWACPIWPSTWPCWPIWPCWMPNWPCWPPIWACWSTIWTYWPAIWPCWPAIWRCWIGSGPAIWETSRWFIFRILPHRISLDKWKFGNGSGSVLEIVKVTKIINWQWFHEFFTLFSEIAFRRKSTTFDAKKGCVNGVKELPFCRNISKTKHSKPQTKRCMPGALEFHCYNQNQPPSVFLASDPIEKASKKFSSRTRKACSSESIEVVVYILITTFVIGK